MHINLRLQKARSTLKKRYPSLIPCFFTYFNALCGFLSITQALEGNFELAGVFIILAILADGIDGKIARALGGTSYFGMELDSLADAISFCLAPIVLTYTFFAEFMTYFGIIVLFAYLCAGLSRLAKFNCAGALQNKFFIGLPTPMAAFMTVLLICFAPYAPSRHYFYINLIMLLSLAVLMISRIKIPSGK